MTDPTTAVVLLRDAENYLSALHGSVARHDNLAANLGCAGCELRDQIGAALTAAPVAAPPTEQAAPLRTRIAEALAREDAHNWGYDHGFVHVYGGDPETDGFVDAVLAVLPPPADRAAVLREAATIAERLPIDDRYRHHSQLGNAWDAGRDAVVRVLRRLAAEGQPETRAVFSPDEGVHGRDPFYESDRVVAYRSADGRDLAQADGEAAS